MYNPFKKKEEDFSLNDMELPSLSDVGSLPDTASGDSGLNGSPNGDVSSLPGLSSSPEPVSDVGNGLPGMDDSTLENTTPGLGGLQQANSTPTFGASNSQSSSSNFSNSNSFGAAPEEVSVQNSSIGDVSNDVLRIKMETLESKVALVDARVSSVEQKIDLILQLIQAEVSDSTRMKVNIDQKMNEFRR